MTASKRQKNLRALNGALFAAFFIASLVLSGMLASTPIPMPGAPATEVVRYYDDSRTAVLASGLLQILSALSLFVFASCVSVFVRGTAGKGGALSGMTLGGGTLAAILLLLSALLSWVLSLTAAEAGLPLVSLLRDLNFLTGGVAHVASLGLFVGATSVAALKTRALPRWICRAGIAAAALSLLSLASLAWFPASVFIPLGRLLAFIWSVAASVVLVCNSFSTGERA